MLYSIIGGVGCGKTTYLQKHVSQEIKEENEDIFFVDPKQLTSDTDSDILQHKGEK